MTENTPSSSRPEEGQTAQPPATLEERLAAVEARADRIDELLAEVLERLDSAPAAAK